MSAFTAEIIGTMLLVLFGNGVVANVVLARTKGNDSGWIVIAAGWGIAVFVGAFCANEFSGAHINPAVSVAMFVAGELSFGALLGYVIAQFIGAMMGAVLVYLFYRPHFIATDDPDAKLACFATAPEIRGNGQAFFCEVVGTFALILPIFLIATPELTLIGDRTIADVMSVQETSESIAEDVVITDSDETFATENKLGLGSIGLLPVALLVFGIGLSLGGTTGYAINPARDLGPRMVHALLPIYEKRDSDWKYAWVPVLGPIVGASLAAILYRMLV